PEPAPPPAAKDVLGPGQPSAVAGRAGRPRGRGTKRRQPQTAAPALRPTGKQNSAGQREPGHLAGRPPTGRCGHATGVGEGEERRSGRVEADRGRIPHAKPGAASSRGGSPLVAASGGARGRGRAPFASDVRGNAQPG